MIEFLLRYHKAILIAAVAASLVSAVLVINPGLREDYRLEAFVATNDQSYVRFRAFMDEFASNEFALVAVHRQGGIDENAEAVVQRLSEECRSIPAVQSLASIEDIPKAVRLVYGDHISKHPLMAGNLISEDGCTLAVLLRMAGEDAGGDERRRTVGQLREIVANCRESNPDLEIMLAGPYVTLIDMYDYVDRDVRVFAPLAFGLTVLTMLIVFRSLRPVVFGTVVGGTAVVCTLGVAVIGGFVTSLITQIIVTLVIILAVANCVHLAAAMEETARALPEADGRERAKRTLARMAAPCAAVMITTAVGFGSVCVSNIAPVRLFGLLMMVGLLLALFYALAGVAVAGRVRLGRGADRMRLANVLERVSQVASRNGGKWLCLFVMMAVAGGWGLGYLRFESDFVKNFREDSEVRRSYEFIEKNLSPLGSVEVVVRDKQGGSMVRAEPVRLGRELVEEVVAEYPMVTKGLSLDDALTLVIPGHAESDDGVAMRLMLIEALPRGESIVRNFINEKRDSLRLNFRCIEGFDVGEKLAACRGVQKQGAALFGDRYEVEVTGLYHFYAGLVDGLLRDQYRSFAITLPAVFVVMLVLLRSLKVTLIAMAVNLLPIAMCLGLMGWLQIPVNMTTVMMISVTLGIAVDDTLHYIWRFRREYSECGDYVEAVRRTHRTVGRACVFTTVVVAGGFSILMFSQFLPTVYFGGLVGATMVVVLAGDLILLPSLLVLLRAGGRSDTACHSSRS